MTQDAKIDKIYDMVFDMKTEIAKSIVHQENHAKSLEEHRKKFILLEDERNQRIGKKLLSNGLFGIVCSGLGAFINHILK